MSRFARRARFAWLALLVVAAALPGAAMAQEAAPDRQDRPSFGSPIPDPKRVTAPNQIIVRYESGTDGAEQAVVRREEDVTKKADLDLINADVVKVEDGSVASAIEDLEANPDVEYAEPDRIVYPMDYADEPRFSELWGLHNTGQTIDERAGTPDVDVDALEANTDDKSSGGEDVVVAVIDDGVDFGHPDLAGRQWKNDGEIPNNNIDDDDNGYVDDVNGYDFGNDDNTVHDVTEDFHGTHVAGTIAASENGEDVVGVAPNVEIMPVKFLGRWGGPLSLAIKAIEYASDNGAKISNNSWGYVGPPDRALEEAIEASGMLFVASAGNNGINNDTGIDLGGTRYRAYPASYDSPNVLSVAANDNTGSLASFSNFGKKSVDISAPGVDVLSTVPSVPESSGLTLSTVGSGRGLVAGFGLEEISTAEQRAEFAEDALGTLGYCTGAGGPACPTETNKVLLVDDDMSSTYPPDQDPAEFSTPDVRETVAQALRSVQNVDLDVVDVGAEHGPSFEELSQYDHVVWATGQAAFSEDPADASVPLRTPLTFNDQNALTRYMNGGGNLFLTGLNTFFFDEDAAFLTQTLGLEIRSDYYTGVFEGATGSSFEGDAFDLNNSPFADPRSHDGLTPAQPNATSLGTVGTPVGYEEYFSGTSMSAPHTTGVAALAAGEFPGLLNRPDALKRLVMETGEPAPLTKGKTVTGDMANARKAVTNTAPRISNTSPTGASNGTPAIRANVVDLQGMLSKDDLQLFVDGNRRMNFSYNDRSGSLSLAKSPARKGRHTVKITATDAQGATTTESWSYRIN